MWQDNFSGKLKRMISPRESQFVLQVFVWPMLFQKENCHPSASLLDANKSVKDNCSDTSCSNNSLASYISKSQTGNCTWGLSYICLSKDMIVFCEIGELLM